MALRFRRTVKLAPGVRLNITKLGISARMGPKGLGVTVGTSGTTVSAGIPGSGLHVSKKVNKRELSGSGLQDDSTQPKESSLRLGRFSWVIAILVVFGLLWLIR
jgi:hypothetical protein